MKPLLALALISIASAGHADELTQNEMDLCGYALQIHVDQLSLISELYQLVQEGKEASSPDARFRLDEESANLMGSILEEKYASSQTTDGELDRLCGFE